MHGDLPAPTSPGPRAGRGARPAPPRHALGWRGARTRRAAARLDGHGRHVPVPGRRDVRPALVRGAGLARVRPHRVARRTATGSRTISADLDALLDALVARRARHAGRPQHGRQHRDVVRGHPAGARAARRVHRGLRSARGPSPSRRRAATASGCRQLREPPEFASFPSLDAFAHLLVRRNPRLHARPRALHRADVDPAGSRTAACSVLADPRAQARERRALPSRGSRGLLERDRRAGAVRDRGRSPSSCRASARTAGRRTWPGSCAGSSPA